MIPYSISLVVFIFIIFILQNFFPITEEFALISDDILIRPWILVTSIFLHSGFNHLLSNLFALGLFGFILEKILGPKKFLQLFFVTGFLASVVSSFFYTASIGASGAVYGVIGSVAILRPKMTVWAFGIPMPMAIAAAVWLALDFAGMFNPTNIANAAHIAGLLSGVAIAFPYRQKNHKRKKDISDEEFEIWENRYMLKFKVF